MNTKYLRTIHPVKGAAPEGPGEQAPITVDVYMVLVAFDVTCPARAHAIKKLLCAGLRGKGSCIQDLTEAIKSVQASIDIEGNRQAGFASGKELLRKMGEGAERLNDAPVDKAQSPLTVPGPCNPVPPPATRGHRCVECTALVTPGVTHKCLEPDEPVQRCGGCNAIVVPGFNHTCQYPDDVKSGRCVMCKHEREVDRKGYCQTCVAARLSGSPSGKV